MVTVTKPLSLLIGSLSFWKQVTIGMSQRDVVNRDDWFEKNE